MKNIESLTNINKSAIKANYKTGLIFSLVLILSAIICFTVNYSIDQLFTWSLYPAGAFVVVWATAIPVLVVKKNKALASFSGLTITLIPYLFLIQWLVAGRGWFIPLALPIAVISLTALGISLSVFNNKRINKLYSMAITVFLFGVVVNLSVEKIISTWLNGTNGDDLSGTLTTGGSIAAAIILAIAGYMKSVKQTANQDG